MLDPQWIPAGRGCPSYGRLTALSPPCPSTLDMMIAHGAAVVRGSLHACYVARYVRSAA